jgi:hypothetical protein
VDPTRLKLRPLVEQILADNGKLTLQMLLETLVPPSRLREVARKHGLTPKGGFRLEKAPAKVLAPMLAELREPDALDDIVEQLAASVRGRLDAASEEGDGAPIGATVPHATLSASPSEPSPAELRKDEEIAQLRRDLEKARETAQRSSEREDELRQRLDRLEEELQRHKTALERAKVTPTAGLAAAAADSDLEQRLHDLEQEIVARDDQDEALRRQLARERSVITELRGEIEELEALLPKGRRRRKRPIEEPPEPERRVIVPSFLPSYSKSLEGKDRKSIERAVLAVFRFCTEGHSYPGLEVKQMHAQDLWSMRASLGLRVYFRHRGPHDVDIVELANREEQNTALRRLKER